MIFEEFTDSRPSAPFHVGDPVIITGNVEYQGKTGDVREVGRDGAFVVVDLYNYGPYSFHASDVSYNDYADSDEEDERPQGVTEAWWDDLPKKERDQYFKGAGGKKYNPVPKKQGVAEQDRVGNMPADKFDDAMARLKKLAGAGPLKTVWDPQKRVYRNMPTAVQPKK